MKSIEERLQIIEDRNTKVEMDKAWETSNVRIFSIAFITYIVATLLLYVIGASEPFLGSIIPTAGFILSTRSINFVKSIWVKRK